MLIERIVSGGQTGADRAALDWALAHGVPHGGWCPAERKAEDGSIAPEYRLQETPAHRYAVRTEWNVRDSDGTVIFSLAAELTGGSLATRRFAEKLGKPWLHVSREASADPAGELREFVSRHGLRVLNVAGPRVSGAPEIGAFVGGTLTAALDEESGEG